MYKLNRDLTEEENFSQCYGSSFFSSIYGPSATVRTENSANKRYLFPRSQSPDCFPTHHDRCRYFLGALPAQVWFQV